ncbi:MAG: MBL fold metallo-hydrolase [Microbacterium sp.]
MTASLLIDHAAASRLAVAGRPERIVPMVVGYEPIAESVSIAGGSRFRYLMEPVTALAVVFTRGWLLVDGGFDPARVRDGDRRRRSFDYENYTPIVPPGDPLRDQVAEAGLDWADLAAALLTHAHFDHTGAARLLAPGQPLMLQRREWEHVRGVADPRAHFLFRDDLDREGLTLVLLDGDAAIAPGVTAIDTSGHTPGHQSIVIELPDRTVVFAGDAADLRANVDGCVACGSTVGAEGPERARAAAGRLAALDARPDTEVWPAHDPEWPVWREIVRARR